jgi:phage baseplate assembly protein W
MAQATRSGPTPSHRTGLGGSDHGRDPILRSRFGAHLRTFRLRRALANEFREARQAGVSFYELRIRVNTVMKNLRYDQTSNVEGPKKICAGPVLAVPRKR